MEQSGMLTKRDTALARMIEDPEAELLALLVPKAMKDSLKDWLLSVAPPLGESVKTVYDRGLFKAEANEVVWFPAGLGNCKLVVLVGTGGTATPQAWREGAVAAAREARKLKAKSVALFPVTADPAASTDEEGTAEVLSYLQAAVEGFWLGQYRKKSYELSKEGSSQDALIQMTMWHPFVQTTEHTAALMRAIMRAEAYAAATNYARDLTNLPGNYLFPEQLAAEAMQLAIKHGLACEVLTEDEIEQLGMGGLLAVGGGSQHPPRMITLRYNGNPDSEETLALIGKGITFDTGGISLKSAGDMDEMISDMAGAATVLGVMDVLGTLKPEVNVLAVIPSAENMPSGTAYRPGDIVKTLSGLTVEVLNTDAEGRIILADAVAYAKQQGASKLIELSTLTGAVLVALGETTTAAITNEESFLAELMTAAQATGEKVWQLPAFPEYKEMLKSDVADVRNSCGRHAGTITAGLFVGTFAESTPFIHLDIAGTAWLSKTRKVDPKGATGVMVRTLAELILRSN